jgi:hypothetical protein
LYAMDGCWRLARPPNCGSEQGQRRASSMPGDAWSCLRSPVAASIKETRRTSCSSTIWSRWYISKSSTSNRSCSSCRPAGSCVIGTHRPLETAPASPEIERISWRAGSSPPRRTCGASSCSTSTVPRPAQPRGRDCRHQQCELETFTRMLPSTRIVCIPHIVTIDHRTVRTAREPIVAFVGSRIQPCRWPARSSTRHGPLFATPARARSCVYGDGEPSRARRARDAADRTRP